MGNALRKSEEFDRHAAYREAVQAPDTEARFLRDSYVELRGKQPCILREDFCGTFALCCEWVKLDARFRAIGIDIDRDPVEYGNRFYRPALNESQNRRLEVLRGSVLDPGLPRADIICALNFSHYIFRDRRDLRAYFSRCARDLRKGGLFVSDSLGGKLYSGAHSETRKLPGFRYYWEQESHDPITNHAVFHIHFKPERKPMIMKAFSYHWRLWSIPELRELMLESGFRKSHVYWEGTTRDGSGNGKFRKSEEGESCDCWVAYVVGEK